MNHSQITTYREYPKVLTGGNGYVIVRSIAEERAITVTASLASDTAQSREPIAALPAPETEVTQQSSAAVILPENEAEWQSKRRERILTRQRDRRHRLRRIDYYPSESAMGIIDKLRSSRVVGGDASSILNRILSEWAAVPEFSAGK